MSTLRSRRVWPWASGRGYGTASMVPSYAVDATSLLFDGVEVAARVARQPTPHRSTSTQFWYKCPGDKTWTLVSRGKDSKYWQTFATPADADLDAAVPYEKLTINGASDGPLFAPIWEERLDDDDEHDDGTWEESRDALRATRIAAALAAVAAWNVEKEGPAPVFSIARGDGSGERRCARVTLFHRSGGNSEDTHEYEPMANAVAAAGGVFVALDDRWGGAKAVRADVVLMGRGARFSSKGATITALKLDSRIVHVNWRNSEHGAESHPGTPGSLFGRSAAPASGSIAQGRPKRGAAPAAATPAAPAESAAELAAAPCFVLDALKAGQPVLDDAAKRFREHYAFFERNRTDRNETRKRGHRPTAWEKFHEEHGDFYPPDYRGEGCAFNDLPPPRASYP